ncbi:MAG: hypothetical protein ACR2KZ_16210 [Segetibacter sp.]
MGGLHVLYSRRQHERMPQARSRRSAEGSSDHSTVDVRRKAEGGKGQILE